MYLNKKRFNYSAADGVQILELPYMNSSLSWIVVLPQNQTLADVENEFANKIDTWMSSLQEQYLEICLPRFSFESKYFLKDTLSDMGMPTAFSWSADLTGINLDGGLFIDKVIHQAFIEVNEEGTEAAAATGVSIGLSSFTGAEFKADHPFLFFILDKQTGVILFIG